MLSICDNADVLSTMRIIKICIQIIKIIVPIILMITIAMSYTKAIASNDNDAVNKAHKSMIKKAIAAAIIFLVPTLVGIIAKLTVNNLEYMKCIANANSAGISEVRYSEAVELISIARKSLNESDYLRAKSAVLAIEDESKRNSLTNDLNAIATAINNKNAQQNNNTQSNPSNTQTTPQSNTNSQNTPATQVQPQVQGAYKYSIFMGDSRTNGMKSVTNSSTDFVIAKDSANYTHLDGHINQAKQILNKYPDTSFNIVLSYGVNMPSGINTYCSKYQNFVNSINSKHRIFIISVNPVDDNRSPYVKNSDIANFNKKIKSCVSGSNVHYCDVNSAASLSTWISSYISDGIHYNRSGYSFIYNQISKCMGK